MPQRHLPLFPQGVTHITAELAFMKENGRVTYFNGHMPVFIHEENDKATFRMITSQFCANGNAKQADIVRAFGVSTISVKRSVKRYREKGPAGFYAGRPPRGPAVLIEPVVAEIDYWVNAMDGQPFFVVSQAVDPGLLQVLEQEIIPRLEQDVPQQHSPEELAADPLLHRFTVVFDREGYSPAFIARRKQKRIACLTYHKHPGEDWPVEEFVLGQGRLPNGEPVTMKLAERGTFLGGEVWVREIRKLTDTNHQTAILSTDYRGETARLAGAMFSRWSQENFFRANTTASIAWSTTTPRPETTKVVVNPAYRTLDGQVRKKLGTLSGGRNSAH